MTFLLSATLFISQIFQFIVQWKHSVRSWKGWSWQTGEDVSLEY